MDRYGFAAVCPIGAYVHWSGRWALESRYASLAGLLEATVAMSALAHEPERREAVLRRLVSS